MGNSWLKLIATEVPQVALVLISPSKEALAVILGLLTVRIRVGAFVTLTVDPPVAVICAVPIPSRLAATLQVPGLLTESGDRVSESAAPLQVVVAFAKPSLRVTVALPPAAVIAPLFELMLTAVPPTVTGIDAPASATVSEQLPATVNTPLLLLIAFGDWQFNTTLPSGMVPLQTMA